MDKKRDRNFLAATIAKMPILRRLPSGVHQELAQKSRIVRCDERTTLLSQGAEHKYLYLVIAGQLDFRGSTSEGDEITLATFGPGGVSSWFSVFHTTRARRDLVGNPGSILLAIPHQLIRTILAQNPSLYPYVIKYEAARVRALLDWQELFLTRDRTRRIALMLIQLAEARGGGARGAEASEAEARARVSKQPIVRLTGERLAQTTNCSRQTLLSSLRKLRDAGLIEQAYGEIRLLDIDGLRAFRA